MPNYKHTFRCLQCKGLVYFRSKNIDANDVPTLWHGELDQVTKASEKSDRTLKVSQCLGRLLYASSEVVEIPVRSSAPVDEEWQELETVVKSAWKAYKASGYGADKRGPNHDRAYVPPQSVLKRLQGSGGMVMIAGTTYTISPSKTTNVALHRQLTEKQGASGTLQSFVFHL
jgi:hypothetical protein